MLVRDIMKREPFTVGEADMLGTAQQTMKRHGIRHLPVVRGDRLAGILSERDVLAARARAGEQAWWKLPVSAAMQPRVQVANPEDSLTEVAGRLAIAKIGALPVVEVGRLVGIITVTDVLDAEVRSAMKS